MAIIKPTPRRRRPSATLVSWPNNIPQRPRGSSSHIPTPAFRSQHAVSKHGTYHARNSFARPQSSKNPASERAFRPVNRTTRPPKRPIRRKSITQHSPKQIPRQQANDATQTPKQKRDDSEDSFDRSMTQYNNAYEHRLHSLRKWVNLKHAEHRIDHGVAKELNAYFGKRKFGERPPAKVLSKYACQALELSEHDLGTDLAWARGRTWMFGERWGRLLGEVIEGRMGEEGYGVCGPGYVGEEDLESWAGDEEYWEGGMGGEEVAREDQQGVGGKRGVDVFEGDVEVKEARDREDGELGWDVEQADMSDDDEAEGLGFFGRHGKCFHGRETSWA